MVCVSLHTGGVVGSIPTAPTIYPHDFIEEIGYDGFSTERPNLPQTTRTRRDSRGKTGGKNLVPFLFKVIAMAAERFNSLQRDRMSSDEARLRGLVVVVPAVSHPAVEPGTMLERWADSGTVYAIQAEVEASPVKIGYSNDWGLSERLKSLQTGNPYKLRIIASAMGYPSHERRCHSILKAHRLTGEWFRWTPEVAAFVQALATGGVERAIATVKILKDPDHG
jgi:hypothetical protein